MELHVHKTGLLYRGKFHVFLFPNFAGSLSYDPAAPEAARIELVVQSASIECTDTWIDADDVRDVLKEAKENMLAVERYPEIRFDSTSITREGEGRFRVAGNLTIRGIARPSTVNVTLETLPDGSIRFSGDAVVKLKDYRLKPPGVLFGVVGTRNEMDFSFSLTARPDGAEQP